MLGLVVVEGGFETRLRSRSRSRSRETIAMFFFPSTLLFPPTRSLCVFLFPPFRELIDEGVVLVERQHQNTTNEADKRRESERKKGQQSIFQSHRISQALTSATPRKAMTAPPLVAGVAVRLSPPVPPRRAPRPILLLRRRRR